MWARRAGLLLVLLLVVDYFVLPQLAGARSAIHLMATVRPGFLALGLLLELASLASYSALSWCLLPTGRRPGWWTVLRIDVSGLGVSHVVPGGGATSTALRYRLFTAAGVPSGDVLTATAIQGVGAALVLAGVFGAGLLIALPSAHDDPAFLVPGLVCAVLFAAACALVVALTREQEQTLYRLRHAARVVPGVNAESVTRAAGRLADRLDTFAADRRLLARTLAWASANWLFDAASLWVFLRAFGQTEGLEGLLIGYGLAGVLALLPFSPGGLGIVEGTLVSVLVGFGTPHANAVLGVVTWRLADFWLPIPLSALAYLSLRTGTLRPRRTTHDTVLG